MNWFGPLASFIAILAMIPVALWLLKRTPLGASAAATAGLRVVAALPLAPNQRLLTVEVGSGDDRRWLVLGVTPAGIRTLHTMPPQAEVPMAAANASLGFAQLLGRHQKARGDSDAR
ncbi:MAG: flagellar biosynthetic protein FliO [Ideonella sp.]|jgi:flagellar protein FliO/FliZ|nr:flagellar biosynthetic protein FliO [Ideonella sp.]